MENQKTIEYKTTKPRVRFCWACGKPLYGNHHAVVLVMGIDKIMHKNCARREYEKKENIK